MHARRDSQDRLLHIACNVDFWRKLLVPALKTDCSHCMTERIDMVHVMDDGRQQLFLCVSFNVINMAMYNVSRYYNLYSSRRRPVCVALSRLDGGMCFRKCRHRRNAQSPKHKPSKVQGQIWGKGRGLACLRTRTKAATKEGLSRALKLNNNNNVLISVRTTDGTKRWTLEYGVSPMTSRCC